jgi:hypothetical protein
MGYSQVLWEMEGNWLWPGFENRIIKRPQLYLRFYKTKGDTINFSRKIEPQNTEY